LMDIKLVRENPKLIVESLKKRGPRIKSLW